MRQFRSLIAPLHRRQPPQELRTLCRGVEQEGMVVCAEDEAGAQADVAGRQLLIVEINVTPAATSCTRAVGCREEGMLVIQRNGRTTVITGWRAWSLGAGLFVGLALILGVIAFVVLGLAITVTAVLLIVLPVAIGVAILASLLQPRR